MKTLTFVIYSLKLSQVIGFEDWTKWILKPQEQFFTWKFQFWVPKAWTLRLLYSSVQLSSVAQSCLTLCDPMNCSMPGLPVHHQLLKLAQTHAHRVGDAIQPSHPLLSPSPPAFNLSQHQGLFQWVRSLHHVAKELELQLQHQSFQWIFKTDFL